MAVIAVQAIRKMKGRAQSQLMLGDDKNLWVVKFHNNPQHVRVLANEAFATHIAVSLGLTVPQTEVLEVNPWLVESMAAEHYELEQGKRERYAPGLHFGSKFVGGQMSGQAIDYLPDKQLDQVPNLREFAGILCLDKWTCNCDSRQAVFSLSRERKYEANFIDHGCCFNTGEWTFPDAPLRGIYARKRVYAHVTGWDSFEPWLQRIEDMEPANLWVIGSFLPPEWYGGGVFELERLIEQMSSRRARLRELITSFRKSQCDPFPQWAKSQFAVSGLGQP